MSNWRHGFLAAAMTLVLTLFAVPSGFSAQAAAVRTTLAENDGYGRMTFNFPGALPSHEASINGGVLVLSFSKPFDFNLDEFARLMPRYVAMARQDDDRKTLRFALKTDFWLDTKTAENTLYLDLLPPQWTGKPPPLPAEVLERVAAAADEKRKAAEAEAVAKAQGIVEPDAPLPGLAVRVGRHAGITRLVFDWNQPVLYSLVQRQGLATITFDRTATVDLASLRTDPPPYLSHATAIEHEGRLAVVLTLKPGVVVNDFREDMSIVLDLKPGQTRTEEMVQDDAAPTPAPVAEEKAAAGPKDIKPAAAQAAEAPQAQPALAEAEEPEAVEAAAPLRNSAVPEGRRPDGQGVANAEAVRGMTNVVVSWPEPVGAAVFERAGRLWIVFDTTLPLDISRLTAETLGALGTPEVATFDGGVALVLPMMEPMLVGAVEDGADWRVSAGETLTTTGRPITLARNWQADGQGSVTFDLKGTRKILTFDDKIVGDRIVVATARGPVQAMQTPRSFVEFQALQTAQGIAIVPVADDVNVAAAPDNVVVSRKDGLTLSGDMEAAASANLEGAALVATTLPPAQMDFAGWREAPGRDFTERRQYHLNRIASAASQDAGAVRLDYAKFLLGYRLAPEARSALDAVAVADSKLASGPAFRAAKGVAEALSGRYVETVRTLSGDGLEIAPHAAVWRGLARAELGHWEAARSEFGLAGAVIDAFEDEDLRILFRSRAAEAALAGGDIDSARRYADGFPLEPETQQGFAQTMLIGAMLADRLENAGEALRRYDAVIENGYPPAAARARFGKALLLNKSGELDDEALAEELQSIRYAWRGDALELDVLSKLVALRLASGDIVEALKLMRIATANYPDSDEAHRMNMRMSDTFADFFLSKDANKMPPVQALAFFNDFKDLTPIGQRGDEMIRDLAERLVEVDLLPQAEQLLDYQVANRLHGGVAKAQVAARLAAIYLLDQKPENALAAIRNTRQNLLPEDLAERRRLLEARALAELKQYDHALDLLEERTDDRSKELRVDVLWEAGRWEQAGAGYELLLNDSWKETAGPLPDDTRLRVMRAAIAYSLASNEAGLSRLRMKFGEAMGRSPDASAFAIVSDPIVEQGIAFREMASRIAAIGTLDRFLASLRSGETSAVN